MSLTQTWCVNGIAGAQMALLVQNTNNQRTFLGSASRRYKDALDWGHREPSSMRNENQFGAMAASSFLMSAETLVQDSRAMTLLKLLDLAAIARMLKALNPCKATYGQSPCSAAQRA